MLYQVTWRLKWALENYLPKNEGPPDAPRLKVLDLGRFDDDERRGELLKTNPRLDYFCLEADPGGPANEKIAAEPYHWPQYADETFDLLVSTHALEHIKFPWRALTEAARVLKPGGLLIVIEPGLPQRVKGIARPSLNRHPGLPDFYRFSSEGLAALAESAGLTVKFAGDANLLPGMQFDSFATSSYSAGEALAVAVKPAAASPPPAKGNPDGGDWIADMMRDYHPSANAAKLYAPRKKKLKISVIGPCFVLSLAKYLRLALPDAEVCHYQIVNSSEKSGFLFSFNGQATDKLPSSFYESDFCFVFNAIRINPQMDDFFRPFIQNFPVIITIPRVNFAGHYPDFYDYGVIFGRGLIGSRIIWECFQRQYSETKTLSFFRHETYERLGYYEEWGRGLKWLEEEFLSINLDVNDYLPQWMRIDPVFMTDRNHPKDFVIKYLADKLAAANGLEMVTSFELHDFDPTFGQRIPVYPEIAAKIGVPERGSYHFMRTDPDFPPYVTVESLGLDEYIHLSFIHYQGLPPKILNDRALRLTEL